MECCNGDDPLIPPGDPIPEYQGMAVPQHFQSSHQAPQDKYPHASPLRGTREKVSILRNHNDR